MDVVIQAVEVAAGDPAAVRRRGDEDSTIWKGMDGVQRLLPVLRLHFRLGLAGISGGEDEEEAFGALVLNPGAGVGRTVESGMVAVTLIEVADVVKHALGIALRVGLKMDGHLDTIAIRLVQEEGQGPIV